MACGALAFKDAKGDQNHLQVPEGERTGSTELLGRFLKHDPAKAADATTYNILVSELEAEVPTGWTTISWNAYYQVPDDEAGNSLRISSRWMSARSRSSLLRVGSVGGSAMTRRYS